MVRKKVTPVRDFFKDRDTEPSTPRNRMPAGGPRRAVVDSDSAPVVPRASTSRRYQPSSSGVPTPSTAPRAVPQRSDQHEVVVRQRPNLYRLPRPRPLKRRAKPGAKVLAEIRKLQRSTDLQIPKAPYLKLVREVVQQMSRDHKRISEEALGALREAGEAFLVTIFECMNRAALHARRVTVMPADLNLVRWILIAFNAFNFG